MTEHSTEAPEHGRTRWRAAIAVLALSAIAAAGLALLVAASTDLDESAAAMAPEQTRLHDELIRLSNDLDASTLEGRACRTGIALDLYRLRADALQHRLAAETAAARIANGRALGLAALVLAAAGLVLGTLHLAAPRGREAVAAGGVGLAGGVLALGAAALAWPEGAAQPPAAPAFTVDLAAFVDRCEDYRRKQE